VVNLFYATDRNYTPSSNPAAMFGSDRGMITYGTCAVTIPQSHVTGELEEPALVHLQLSEDPAKHIVLASATTLDAKSFYGDIAASIKRNKDKSAFVFVHGYNVTFKDAARRTAQMAYDLGYTGTPIFFSWPSHGKYLDYSYDEANIEYARADLEQFIADFVKRTSAARIYLVGHSMGTRALTNALVNLFKDKPEIRSRITDIILAAPDIDADVFKRDIAPRITGTNQNVTLYASSRDWALRASKFFHGYERAGDSEPQVTIAPRLVTIDSSAIETDFLGHSYFAQSESIIKDIVAIFSGKSDPSVRSYLIAKEIASGKYWVMPGAKQ
jgi:esterase/lipase superfamily enzyme